MYERETYHWRKAHHVCTKCGKEDAEPHKTLCAECAAKCAATDKKYRDSLDEERRRRIKQQKQAQKDRRRSSGLCVECGKTAVKGRRFCLDCMIKTRRRNKKQYDAKRVKTIFADGLCCRCNEPALPDNALREALRHRAAQYRKGESPEPGEGSHCQSCMARRQQNMFPAKEKAPERRQPHWARRQILTP